mmetsp:Transcript_4149/g.5508  ORF Transcript_4149/g.5508 Transcript_4149/m.5508 type:complete len:97 (+) Transcript_4149:390-680(+)
MQCDGWSRQWFSLANMQSEGIIVTGGLSIGGIEALSAALIFKIDQTFGELPEMNQVRYAHSSCCLGKFVYVFGGMNGSKYLGSIEKLLVKDGGGPK